MTSTPKLSPYSGNIKEMKIPSQRKNSLTPILSYLQTPVTKPIGEGSEPSPLELSEKREEKNIFCYKKFSTSKDSLLNDIGRRIHYTNDPHNLIQILRNKMELKDKPKKNNHRLSTECIINGGNLEKIKEISEGIIKKPSDEDNKITNENDNFEDDLNEKNCFGDDDFILDMNEENSNELKYDENENVKLNSDINEGEEDENFGILGMLKKHNNNY